jgi:hypothetical protein
MTSETRSTDASTPILHSQLILPMRRAVALAGTENYESFWVRVHRICDQYIQSQGKPASCSRSD